MASSGHYHAQQDSPQPLADVAMVASVLADVHLNEKALEATASGVLDDERLMPKDVLKYPGEVEAALRCMREAIEGALAAGKEVVPLCVDLVLTMLC